MLISIRVGFDIISSNSIIVLIKLELVDISFTIGSSIVIIVELELELD